MYGFTNTNILPQGVFLRGRNASSGALIGLIGMVGDFILIDPAGVGVVFGGSVYLPAGGYLGWGPTPGALGYGLRDNAGTLEYKNSGGGWAPIAAAASAAGGWTDDGVIVRLSTGTDQVVIGGAVTIGAASLSITGGAYSIETVGAAQFRGTMTVPITGLATSIGSGADLTTYSEAMLNAGATQARWGVEAAAGGSGFVGTFTNKPFIIRQNNLSAMHFLPAETVHNDLAADRDFRVESVATVNLLMCDAGALGGVGSVCFGGPVSDNQFVRIGCNTGAIATASLSFMWFRCGGSNSVVIPAGTTAFVASAFFSEPNITAVGGVTDAYTVIIGGPPTEATNNGSLWVQNGQVRLSNLPTAAAGLVQGTVWNNAGVLSIIP